MHLNTIRFKVTVLYSIIVAIVLLVYSAELHVGLISMLYKDIDSRLFNKVQKIEKTISDYGQILEADSKKLPTLFDRVVNPEGEQGNVGFTGQKATRLNEYDNFWEELRNKLDLDEDYVLILYPEDKIAAVSDNLDDETSAVLEKEMQGLSQKEIVYKDLTNKKLHFRLISLPAVYHENNHYRICVISSTQDAVSFIVKRGIFMATTAPIVLAATCFFGVFLVARALKPIARIAKVAEDIGQENLSQRVKAELKDKEVSVLTDAFNGMLSRLEKSFKQIEEFSSNAAHELKTPLAIIRCESEYALKKDQDNAEYKRIVNICQEESQRMLKTIDDLLLLTKLDNLVGEWQIIDLSPYLFEIVEQNIGLAFEKSIVLTADLGKEPLYSKVVALHLRRVFVNLIDNAIKFTPAGGKITVVARKDHDKAVISVSDTGIGIPAKNLPKLFDRFFHTEDTDGASGSGLGLGIAKRIVEAHDGTILVTSQPGKGTTFTVSLLLA